MNEVTTIDALTLSNMYQLSLVEHKDLLGALTYVITVTKDGKEESKQVFEDKDVALGIFERLKQYYQTFG